MGVLSVAQEEIVLNTESIRPADSTARPFLIWIQIGTMVNRIPNFFIRQFI